MSVHHYERIAAIYDLFVNTDYDVKFFVDELDGITDPILELMAGTGRLTMPLLKAGFSVVAVDFSADMLSVLRSKLVREGLTAELHEMDVTQLDLGRQFKKIIIPFQAFPEITTNNDQKRALQAIFEHLEPGGEFVCTLHNPVVRMNAIDNQLRLAARQDLDHGGHLLVWLLQKRNPDTNVVEVMEFFEEYDANGVMTSKRYSPLQFHLLARKDFQELVDEVGFEIVHVYGDYSRGAFSEEHSPFMIWILRRSD